MGMAAKKATPSTSLSQEAIRTRLRGTGLRATPGRIATYALLHDAAQPLTHSDVVERLSHTGVDRATLFRNLQDLTEAGLVSRTDLGDHVWRFELEGRHTGHPHFVCTDCGDVACLEDVDIEVKGRHVPRSIESQNVEVQVRGRCDACAD